MLVALATNDRCNLDAHFGSARHLAIYEVDADAILQVGMAAFADGLSQDGDEDKLVPKLQAMADCGVVFAIRIGPSAIRRLMAAGIQPVLVHRPEPLQDVVAKLQGTMRGTPPAWLLRVQRAAAARRAAHA